MNILNMSQEVMGEELLYDENVFECKIREILKKERISIYVGDYVKILTRPVFSVLRESHYPCL
jgi:translation initiation factor IF-1